MDEMYRSTGGRGERGLYICTSGRRQPCLVGKATGRGLAWEKSTPPLLELNQLHGLGQVA